MGFGSVLEGEIAGRRCGWLVVSANYFTGHLLRVHASHYLIWVSELRMGLLEIWMNPLKG